MPVICMPGCNGMANATQQPLGYAKVPQQDEHKPGKCDTRCTANQGDWCGGGWHNSVYKTR